MTELRDLLDAYAHESGAIKPDDGIRREQCARRAFTALRAVLDAMDLVAELMPNGTPAVPVSVLRGVITRALADDGLGDPQKVFDSAAPQPPTDKDQQLGAVMSWPYPPGPELFDTPAGHVVRAACPCLHWAVTDLRTAAFPGGHHEHCDGTGHRKDQP